VLAHTGEQIREQTLDPVHERRRSIFPAHDVLDGFSHPHILLRGTGRRLGSDIRAEYGAGLGDELRIESADRHDEGVRRLNAVMREVVRPAG